jgi:hypothetical protein
MATTRTRGDEHFPVEIAGFLKRAGLVTATALIAMAIVLAASASFDPSLGRERQPPSPAATSGEV